MHNPEQSREFNEANKKLIGDYASRAADYFRRKCEGLLNANSDNDYRLTPIEGRFAVALYWRMFEALISDEYFCMHGSQATTVSTALILDNDLMIFKVYSEFMRTRVVKPTSGLLPTPNTSLSQQANLAESTFYFRL